MKIKRDKLDILFAQYIKLRDKYCQRCGGSSGLQTAHFHSRRKQSVRQDEENSCLLCFGCHIYLDGNPLEKIEFFKQRLGEEGFALLTGRAYNTHPKPDKEAIRLYLQEKIAEIRSL